MKQVAEIYTRSVTDEDLQLYLKYHGSLREFKDFCSNYKDITLREYLVRTIKQDMRTISLKRNELDSSSEEFMNVIQQLCSQEKIRASNGFRKIVLKLEEANFLRIVEPPFYSFNSRASESSLRVYCGVVGDSEFLKEVYEDSKISQPER